MSDQKSKVKWVQDPSLIEQKSLEIIDELLGELDVSSESREIIKRIVHSTGDVSIAESVVIEQRAIAAGLEAIRAGKDIITDVNMVKAGINEEKLRKFGGEVKCFIADSRVIEQSRGYHLTRASVAMSLAAHQGDAGIIAIGNAPTALFVLCDLIEQGSIAPGLVIGTPVGFVGAKESKQRLMGCNTPYITVKGYRGGSAIAVAVINALLYML
jgi:precorrin-8X/cobalt-precorrin-8 methylmutase